MQQVTISRGDNQSVEVECLFLQGSEALGCYVELMRDNKQMIMERISRPKDSFVARGEITLDLALSCYEIYIYDWEADNTAGTVPIPVGISYVNRTSVEHCRTTVSPPSTELSMPELPTPGVFRQAELCVCVCVCVCVLTRLDVLCTQLAIQHCYADTYACRDQ